MAKLVSSQNRPDFPPQKQLHLWFETDLDEINAIFHLRRFPIEYTMNRLLMWGGNVVVHFSADTLYIKHSNEKI
jgi:hypothetical protein